MISPNFDMYNIYEHKSSLPHHLNVKLWRIHDVLDTKDLMTHRNPAWNEQQIQIQTLSNQCAIYVGINIWTITYLLFYQDRESDFAVSFCESIYSLNLYCNLFLTIHSIIERESNFAAFCQKVALSFPVFVVTLIVLHLKSHHLHIYWSQFCSVLFKCLLLAKFCRETKVVLQRSALDQKRKYKHISLKI